MNAIGYIRVSTDEQAQSGAGLDAQRAAILSEAIRRGWTIVRIIEDAGLSGKTMSRPGLEEAITMLRAGEADILVAAKLDRISRSALGFLQLAKQSQTEGWQLRVLDADLDTSTPMGRFAIGILALVAELERDLIAQRTKDALAGRKAKGIKLGRPVRDTKTRGRIVALRANGATYREIVETLASDEPPEGQPRKVWSISSVRNVCKAAGCNTRGIRVRAGSSPSPVES
jgi:DNA invertase Pin-like site-specific DNA recombinase